MAALSLIVRFELREGHEEAFDSLVADALDAIHRHEPGTWVYTVHVPEGEPGVRVFYELYADDAAFVAHEQTPAVRRFLDALDTHTSRVEVHRLTLVDGVRRGQ